MRELIDCHVHTEGCGHATGTVAQMVGAAVFTGLTGILFTEHLPLPADLDPHTNLAPTEDGFRAYSDGVRAMVGRAKGLQLVLGAEADWLPGREEAMATQRRVAEEAGVEVLLGSVHFLDGWSFDDPANLASWDGRDVDEVWREYFGTWCDASVSKRFDVMAHPDLVKKFGHRPSFDPSELYEAAAEAAAEGGVLVEFSTAGWRKPVAEAYPGPELLAAFARHGVGVTVGSDAHSPDEVGYRIGEAYDALAAAGFRKVALPLGGGEVRYIEL